MSTRTSSFASQVIVYGLGIGANRLLWLIVLPVLSSFLSPADFGRIASLTVLGLMLRTIFGLGVSSAVGIVYFDVDEKSHRARVIGSALTFVALSGLALVLITAVVAEPLATKYLDGSDLGYLIIVQAGAVAFQLISEPLMLRLQFDKRARAYVGVSVVVPVIGASVMLALVAYFELGVLGWAVGQLINGSGQLALALWVATRHGQVSRGSMALMRQILRYSLPLLPSVIFVYIIMFAGHFFLKERSTLEVLGIYNLGFSLGMVMNLFTNAFNSAWYPHFQSFAKRQDAAREEFSRIAALYLGALCVLVLLAYVFARPTVFLLTVPKLYDAYLVVGAIAVSQALLGFWTVLLPVLYFNKKVSLVSYFQAISALVVSVGCWVTIPYLGATGAAYSVIAGSAVLICLQIAYNASSQINVCDYNWRKLVTMTGITVILIVLFKFLEDMSNIWVPFSLGLCGIVGVCSVMWRYYLDQETRTRVFAFINLRKGR